jgi:hypothetical protein
VKENVTDNNFAGYLGFTTRGAADTGTEKMRISSTGNVGIGVTAPTAMLHLKAGTTAASTAPLKLTTGTSMTGAEAGAVEFTTDDLYFTITTGAARKPVVLADAALTAARIPYTTTNGRITTHANLQYDGTNVTLTGLKYPAADGSAGAHLKTDGAGILSFDSVEHSHNALINGGFRFFQRQNALTLTSISNDTYGPDRWYILTQTANCETVAVVPGFIDANGYTTSQFAGRIKQTQAAAQRMGIAQIVEGTDSQTLSAVGPVIFQAKINCSSSQPIRIAIIENNGGGVDSVTSDIVLDWTSNSYTANAFFLATNLGILGTANVTPSANTWTSISVTGTPTTACQNFIGFIWTEGTAANGVTLDITEAGIYAGTTIRPWRPRPVQQELALCQRYYEKSYTYFVAPGTALTAGGSFSSFIATGWFVYSNTIYYKVSKRATSPGPTLYSDNTAATTGVASEYDGGSNFIADRASSIINASDTGFSFQAAAGAYTVGNFMRVQWTAESEL